SGWLLTTRLQVRVLPEEPIKNITARELAVFYCGQDSNLLHIQ
ncbi:MAG: hypothetical protein XE06_0068, partial [Anaerolineaceae bacterium 46_22]